MSILPSVAALCMIILIAAANKGNYLKREFPMEARRASVQVGAYRSFMLATSYYVNANPTFAGTITWATLAAADTTPDAMRGITIGADWKAIADGSGQWVVCAEVSEASVAAIAQAMNGAVSPSKVSLNGTDYLWFGDSATASTNVAKCG